MVETDVLIVGTGPAGAGAAALLAGYGIDHIAVNKYGSTAREPRAHITNQRAVEVFRDLGIERELKRYATPKAQMAEHVFCTSLTGEELGRLKAWGNSPASRAGHDTASPTEICDFTQNYWEPVLLTAAATRGGKVRFHTEYLSLEQDSEGVTVTLHDRLIDHTYKVRAKYLIGADGARSRVAQDIGLPIEGKMDIAASINIVFEADLTHLVAHRPGGDLLDYPAQRRHEQYGPAHGASMGPLALHLRAGTDRRRGQLYRGTMHRDGGAPHQ